MSKAVAGAALLGADVGMAVLLSTVTLGAAAVPMAEVFNALAGPLLAGGISMEASAIAGALTSNRGMAITTRQAAAYRQICYGQQRLGGITIFESTTGSSHDQYNYVIVLAGHEIDSIQNLYLDGRQVHWLGSGVGYSVRNGVGFGGVADGNTYTGPDGQQYNFGGTGHSGIYAEARYGDQLPGDVIGGLTANDPNWAADGLGNSPWAGGVAYIYLKVEFNQTLFPSAPEIRVTVNGKNDILDPRTGTTGFTSNWALICADVLSDTTFGLGDPSVNQAQLIAAANVCDESVLVEALSATTPTFEARYTTNWHYDTAVGPGDVLATMMPGAQGRLSRIGGEWYIWPAYWQGPSFTFDENSLTAALQWTPYRSTRDLFNRVNGTYIAPTYPYNVAGNLYDQNGFYDGGIQNNFPFAYQPTNYPQYAADVLHGFASDQYLIADGGRLLPKEIVFQTVLSVTQAQRCASIALKRNRQQGSGSLEMSLPAYSMQPVDVMQFSFSQMGWTEKTLEVVGTSFRCEVDEGGQDGQKALSIRVSANVIETDVSVYEWSTIEELTVYDVPATPTQQSRTPAPPTSMSLTCSAGTALTDPITGIVTPRIEVQWDTPLDVRTTGIQVQYQLDPAGSPTGPWIDAGVADVSLNLFYIGGLVNNGEYNVRIRSVRPSGATSGWVEIDGFTVSLTLTVATQLALAPGTLIGEAFAPVAFTGDTSTSSTTITSVSSTMGLIVGQVVTGAGIPSGATITAIGSGTITLSAMPTATASSVALTGAGTALIEPVASGTFSAVVGNTTLTVSPANYPLGVLNQGQLYWVYYVDPTLVGGAVTAIATPNASDFLNRPGYFLIGSLVTPTFSGGGGGGGGGGSRYAPSTFSDVGTRSTLGPALAYDGDTSSNAIIGSQWNNFSVSVSKGQCIYSGFPAVITSSAMTLNVMASVLDSVAGVPCTIDVSGPVSANLLTTGGDVALTTYTLSIPSGTALSALTVTATADATGLGGGGGGAGVKTGAIAVYEIWIA